MHNNDSNYLRARSKNTVFMVGTKKNKNHKKQQDLRKTRPVPLPQWIASSDLPILSKFTPNKVYPNATDATIAILFESGKSLSLVV